MKLYTEVERLADEMKDPDFKVPPIKTSHGPIIRFLNANCRNFSNSPSLTKLLYEILEQKGLI